MTAYSYLLFLSGMYLVFLMMGLFFYIATAKVNPIPWKSGNRFLKIFRFFMYVILIPAGMTGVTAVYLIYSGHMSLF